MTLNNYFADENLIQLCKYINELFMFLQPQRVELAVSTDEEISYLHIGIAIQDLKNIENQLDELFLEECVDMINKRLMYYSESDLLVGVILFYSKESSLIEMLEKRGICDKGEIFSIDCNS